MIAVNDFDAKKSGRYSLVVVTVADSRGRPPPPKTFSISCSFPENSAKPYVGAPQGWRPLLRGILDPPLRCNRTGCKRDPVYVKNYDYKTLLFKGPMMYRGRSSN